MFCNSIIMTSLLLYVLAVTYIWCFVIAEVTIFTTIGGAVSPTMAFHYFVLASSVLGTIYGMIQNLYEGYDRILEVTIDILKGEATCKSVQKALVFKYNGAVVIKKKSSTGSQSVQEIQLVKAEGQSPCTTLIRYDPIMTYINTDMYFAVVDRCQPVRRQVLFILIKIIAMVFYIWLDKNVFHLEEKVGAIINLISSVAVYFVPAFLQYIAHQKNFGKKMTAVLKQNVYKAIP